MEHDDSLLISQLNGLKCFQDFWSIKGSSITEADFLVFQTRYNTTNFTNSKVEKFRFLQSFTTEDISVIKNHRIPFLTNPLIKGLYCDILATILNKDSFVYAKESIRCYLEVLSNYSHYDQWMILGVLIGCTRSILSYNQDRNQIKRVLQSYLYDETVGVNFRRIILCFLYDSGFSNAIECQAVIDDLNLLEVIHDHRGNKDFFEYALRIAQASNKPIEYRNLIYHRLAENEDIILSQHPLDTFAVKELNAKSEYLELGHFNEEAQECRKLINIAKSNKRDVFHLSVRLEIDNSCFSGFASNFSIKNPFEVLASEDILLPEPTFALDAIENEERLPEGIRQLRTDINGNVHENKESIPQQLQKYTYRYKSNCLAPMLFTLHSLIKNKTFCYRSLMNYLRTTWLAKPRIQVNVDLKVSQESWLDLMAPSLKLLCHEIIREYKKNGYKSNYVCCSDSLTLKIEGCIRDIARIRGLKTTYCNGQEVALDGLLDQMGGVMSPKTILLLKSVLTKDGLNLRNNYAHGFSSLVDYNLNNAFSLLHCLLKISAVQFELA